MQIISHGQSDQGKVRHQNEDAFFIDRRHQVFAVADGLGGLPGGADASNRIVELLALTMSRVNSVEERVDLGELTIGIHQIIMKEGQEAHPFTGSGSTLTLGQIVGKQLLIAHVGDSAAYLLREGELEKLTIDHTLEQEWIKRMGEDERHRMPPEYPHTLTRCVGQEAELRVDQTRIGLKPGDRLLFCSDGLNKVLDEDELVEHLEVGEDPKPICQSLIDAANENHGPDNITLIVVLIGQD
ncbi:PP2C family protein-serine/threonine phosphatase [Coraliomargarita parva]|uniref:PP2C family protein-serine/threonine phosphatase n=1 Tax=Coraliomargarita parva TaxID=3014050 RepID=UPI0022B55AD4|nr:protein phosphatase 2C domain-containing protein [Coraliomargarita parva]